MSGADVWARASGQHASGVSARRGELDCWAERRAFGPVRGGGERALREWAAGERRERTGLESWAAGLGWVSCFSFSISFSFSN